MQTLENIIQKEYNLKDNDPLINLYSKTLTEKYLKSNPDFLITILQNTLNDNKETVSELKNKNEILTSQFLTTLSSITETSPDFIVSEPFHGLINSTSKFASRQSLGERIDKKLKHLKLLFVKK